MIITSPQFIQGQGLTPGDWKGELKLTSSESLPFTFNVFTSGGKTVINIFNAEEKIRVDEISFLKDSFIARLPVFDSEIRAKTTGNTLEGEWLNYSRKTGNRLPFKASLGSGTRFKVSRSPAADVSGKWEVDFSPGTPDSGKALGVFSQEGNKLTGTFLTPTGDYRYLEGNVDGDSIYLSCFDGSHAFLFKAKAEQGRLQGTFWSGSHWKESWTAIRNEKFELPDPETLTYLKPGYSRLDFSFPSASGDTVSLSDPEFRDRVVIVQIMGTWCPNCMDETAFLSGYFRRNRNKSFKVIGLAFEKTADKKHAWENIARLQRRFKVDYPMLLAGSSNKQQASAALPMLNQIMSYPTTIFIDKKGVVRKIHTGFSGPATGQYYDRFVEEFDSFVNKLLAE